MSVIETLRERRAAMKGELEALITAAEGESRSLNEDEAATFDGKTAELRKLDERITELQDAEVREARAAANRVETGAVATTQVREANPIYRRDDPTGPSYFRDLFTASKGDLDSRDRLVRNTQGETRALSTTAGAGGQFAPPAWLVEDFVALARPGRVTADLVNGMTLPAGISSVNLPTVSGGTAAGVQASQNAAVTSTDLTTSAVSSNITTIAGQQQVAMQLLEQSGIPFDRVVLGDLARAYAVALDTQVLNGSGASGQLAGILNASGTNAITYTDAAPAVVGSGKFYSQVLQALNAVATNRYLPATALVMHPRRWSWVLDALDTQNRPLVVPNGPAFNQLGTGDGVQAQNAAGTLLGVPVYVDPNVPTNLGAGTNQDPVIAMRADDLWLWETALQSASFDATYANQMTILFRVHAYSAFIPNRYPKSISVINGTGLVAPTF